MPHTGMKGSFPRCRRPFESDMNSVTKRELALWAIRGQTELARRPVYEIRGLGSFGRPVVKRDSLPLSRH
jgi:hypothetical protein